MKKFLSTFLSKGRRKNRIRIVVAMSGGVDSSVAAALLKKQGYDVVGVFMRFWSEPADSQFNSPHPPLKISFDIIGSLGRRKNKVFSSPSLPIIRGGEERRNTCCSEGAEAAARAVAAKLDIPFYVLRLEKEFKKAVVDYFLAEEKKGRTPNPCVVCNKKIKFGLLFKKALGMGADCVATGHYVRVKKDVILSPPHQNKFGAGQAPDEESSRHGRGNAVPHSRGIPRFARNDGIVYRLFKAKDENKDQSYFLYILNQQQLSQLLFPVGNYTKDEVYQMAKKWQLPYRQGESFDLCFVAKDRETFIKKYLKLKLGKILKFQPHPSPLLKKERGNDVVLGEHQGLPLYTIGQRKSLSLQQGPWWVVKKDERKNILYVSNDEKDLYSSELAVTNINWLSGRAPKLPMKVLAKIRYKSEVAEATLRAPYNNKLYTGQAQGKNQFKLIFERPQRAITPGQSVMFYNQSREVLGGGIIKNS